LFAVVRERAGRDQMDLQLPAGATVATAADALTHALPQVGPSLSRVAFAVNRHYAPLTLVLSDNDELAVIPPVSGG
jgi:molybdopterin converting factor small subunit